MKEKRDWALTAVRAGTVVLVTGLCVGFAGLLVQAVVMRGVPLGPAWGNWWKVLMK